MRLVKGLGPSSHSSGAATHAATWQCQRSGSADPGFVHYTSARLRFDVSSDCAPAASRLGLAASGYMCRSRACSIWHLTPAPTRHAHGVTVTRQPSPAHRYSCVSLSRKRMRCAHGCADARSAETGVYSVACVRLFTFRLCFGRLGPKTEEPKSLYSRVPRRRVNSAMANACTHHGGRFVCMHVWCAHSATSLPNQALSLPVSRSASRCVCHQHRASHAIHAVLLLLVDENTRAGCRAREASANHSPPYNHEAAALHARAASWPRPAPPRPLPPPFHTLSFEPLRHHGQAN